MIPQNKHTQPLLRDLSVQAPGVYLLTIYGQTSKKYIYINKYSITEGILHFEVPGMKGPGPLSSESGAIPAASLWTIYPANLLEYPTFEELARQEVVDQTHLKALHKELFPGNGHDHEKGGPQVMVLSKDQMEDILGQTNEGKSDDKVPEWYEEQRKKQYL